MLPVPDTLPHSSSETDALRLLARWPNAIDFVVDQRMAGADWTAILPALRQLIRVPVMV